MEKILHTKHLKGTLQKNVVKLKESQKQLFTILTIICITLLAFKNTILLKIIAAFFITSYLAYNFYKIYLLLQSNTKHNQN